MTISVLVADDEALLRTAFTALINPWGALTWTPVLGILAALLVVGSKNEFSRSASKPPGAEHEHTDSSADG